MVMTILRSLKATYAASEILRVLWRAAGTSFIALPCIRSLRPIDVLCATSISVER